VLRSVVTEDPEEEVVIVNVVPLEVDDWSLLTAQRRKEYCVLAVRPVMLYTEGLMPIVAALMTVPELQSAGALAPV